MEDENHGNNTRSLNGPNGGSPENPCLIINTNCTPATSCNSIINNNILQNHNHQIHNHHHHHHHHHHSSNKEQDRFLPIANVGRIMKKVIPANGKISKDAKETVQECVSEFISFVTGEASDKCQREKRKTINGEDIIWAITTLGFEDYVHPLKFYLQKYREFEGEKLNVPKGQQRLEQRIQQEQEQVQSLPPNSYTSVYSSTSLMSQPTSFITAHQHDQAFSLPFTPTSIQKQLQPQEQYDSVGHW